MEWILDMRSWIYLSKKYFKFGLILCDSCWLGAVYRLRTKVLSGFPGIAEGCPVLPRGNWDLETLSYRPTEIQEAGFESRQSNCRASLIVSWNTTLGFLKESNYLVMMWSVRALYFYIPFLTPPWSASVGPSVMSDSGWPHGLWSTRLLCPWDFPDKNTRVGSHSLLQRIFLTQGSNQHLLHFRRILYWMSHLGSPAPP